LARSQWFTKGIGVGKALVCQDASGHIKTGVGGEMLPLGDVICVNFNPREVGFQRWRALWRPTPKCL